MTTSFAVHFVQNILPTHIHCNTWFMREITDQCVISRLDRRWAPSSNSVPSRSFPPNVFIAKVFLLVSSTPHPRKIYVVMCLFDDRFKFNVPCSSTLFSFSRVGRSFLCSGKGPWPLFALTHPSPLPIAAPMGVGQSLTSSMKSVHNDRFDVNVCRWMLVHDIFNCCDSSKIACATMLTRFCLQGVKTILTKLHAHSPSRGLSPLLTNSEYLCACPHPCPDVVSLRCSCQALKKWGRAPPHIHRDHHSHHARRSHWQIYVMLPNVPFHNILTVHMGPPKLAPIVSLVR